MAHKEVISKYKALAMRLSVNDCVVKIYNVAIDRQKSTCEEKERMWRERERERG